MPSPARLFTTKVKWKCESSGRDKRSQVWKISVQVPLTDHLFPLCDGLVGFYLPFRLLPEALWKSMHVITGLCKWKLCALIFLLVRKPSLAFPFPLYKSFPLWHVVFICWTEESVRHQIICLSCSAKVMFFMPELGNFFQCVIEAYDNYPFSISTVDMFIVLNVHLSILLLFCSAGLFLF